MGGSRAKWAGSELNGVYVEYKLNKEMSMNVKKAVFRNINTPALLPDSSLSFTNAVFRLPPTANGKSTKHYRYFFRIFYTAIKSFCSLKAYFNNTDKHLFQMYRAVFIRFSLGLIRF